MSSTPGKTGQGAVGWQSGKDNWTGPGGGPPLLGPIGAGGWPGAMDRAPGPPNPSTWNYNFTFCHLLSPLICPRGSGWASVSRDKASGLLARPSPHLPFWPLQSVSYTRATSPQANLVVS